MKKVVIVALVVFLASCNKSAPHSCNQNQVTDAEVKYDRSSIYSESEIHELILNSSKMEKDGGEKWRKFVKWVRAHIGTHLFHNCGGVSDCGPCPGICFTGNGFVPTGDGNLPDEKLDSLSNIGYFGLYQLSDSTIGVVFNHNEDFVTNRNFYVQSDIDLGTDVAKLFGYQKLIFKKGVYAMDYSIDPLGETIVEIQIK